MFVLVMLAGACAAQRGDDLNGASGDQTGAGEGGFYGAAGNGSAASGSVGAGGGVPAPPYYNGSYSYLCGGSGAPCTPGTSDCTPGGNPNMSGSSSSGGSIIACQLVSVDSKVTAQCNPVGLYGVGDPCEKVDHCGAGLGCVTNTGGGVCREYCCGDVEDCPSDTYCATVRMTEAAEKVPVCIPVTKCTLLDNSICKNGQVCTIVRDDGTTSCIDEGPGQLGQGCPCADGYVCSKINNTCLKLCHVGNDAVDCAGGGTCQSGVSGYPEGIGICVGFK
jgi:hypothetical protein